MRTIEQLEAILKALREQLAELQDDRNSGAEVPAWKESLARRELDKYTAELEARREEKAAVDKAEAEAAKRHADQQAAVMEAVEEAYTVLEKATAKAAEAHAEAIKGLPAYREARAAEVEAYRNLRGLVEQLDEPERDEDGHIVTDRAPFYMHNGNVMQKGSITPGRYGRVLDRV